MREFDEAVQDGRPLRFALGCLVTAWGQMPFHDAGRHALAKHAVAFGLIVPIAIFHFGCGLSGLRFMLSGHDHYYAMLVADGASGRALASAYRAATPALAGLLLMLGFAHLLIAWVVLNGQWRRASILWLFATAVAVTIITIIAQLVPHGSGIAIQLAALAIELAAIPCLAARQPRQVPLHRI